MKKSSVLLLRVSSILWIIWGLVHTLAGVLVLSGDTTSGFQAIGDGVDPATIEMDYPGIVGGVLNQHAWNLAWFGIVTIIGGVLIWRKNMTAIWVTAMVGGLADLGYFFFVDLAGYARFVPGTVMTIVSALAILLSMKVWFSQRSVK